MARRREANVFSLSFLDIMSCGFGAVILIFIVIDHASEVESTEISAELQAEVTLLEERVERGAENLVELRNTLDEADDEIITAQAMTRQLVDQIRELEQQIANLQQDGASSDEDIAALKEELKQLEEEANQLEGTVGGDERTGTALRSIPGEGNRLYLTGMNVGGRHILVLIDASASMLHRKIANAVRMSLRSDEMKLQSQKWQRAIRTVEWIIANLPADSNFQLMTFNTTVSTLVVAEEGDWLTSIQRNQTDAAMDRLKATVPAGSTSLHIPFAAIRDLDPQPDNIFLIVDSLPTMEFQEPKQGNISPQRRQRIFEESLDQLPPNIPVNVILFPMEGDPGAAPNYWILAQKTGGSFITLSNDDQ